MELQLSYDDLWPFYMDFHGIYAQLDCSSAHTQHAVTETRRESQTYFVVAAARGGNEVYMCVVNVRETRAM